MQQSFVRAAVILEIGDVVLKKKISNNGKRKSQEKTRTRNKKVMPTTAISTSRRYEIMGLFFLAAGLISVGGLLDWNVGFIGLYFAKFLRYLFGLGAWIVSGVILLIGMQYVTKHRSIVYSTHFFGLIGLFVSLLAILHHFLVPVGSEILPEYLPNAGGLLGGGILFLVRKFFGATGSIIFLCTGIIAAVLLSTTWSLAVGILHTKRQAKTSIIHAKDTLAEAQQKVIQAENILKERMHQRIKASFYNQDKDKAFTDPFTVQDTSVHLQRQEDIDDAPSTFEKPIIKKEPTNFVGDAMYRSKASEKEIAAEEMPSFSIEYAANKVDDIPRLTDESSSKSTADFESAQSPKDRPIKANLQDESLAMPQQIKTEENFQKETVPHGEASYQLPNVEEILTTDVKKKNIELEREIAENAQTLSKTFENFKVKAKIINACHGPAVTRYEIEPAPGVKVSKITNLADDLALSLAAFSVRIEPIPGKAAIGIEVPNKELEGIRLREVLEKPAFAEATSQLTVGLGVDITGQGIFADLSKMPHLLVAGATGSGKSVCINTIITSVLFKAKPDEVKFILIDPKMVELSNYNGIPHLMVPVVTDAKKAASVLNWSVQEMEKRYAQFASTGVRDMTRFNVAKPEEKMPAIIIIIDELADLMMVAPHDVEDAICRLAQKARAAGIHLVLATQRPSVDVITGIIKANIPSRISFAVSSQIDSRTILDMSGAEKLLGKGDMLFYPVGSPKPQRVQGAFISDEEVERLLEFIRSQGQQMQENQEIIEYTENATIKADKEKQSVAKEKVDALLGDAIELVMNAGQASTSSIQRRFRIGYTRAARLIDTMEEMKIIGPSVGSKPREILVSSEEAEAALQKIS